MVVASDKVDYGSFADTSSPGTQLNTTTTNNSNSATAATINVNDSSTPRTSTSTAATATGRRRGSGSGSDSIVIVDEGVRIGSAGSPVSYSYQQAVVHPHPRPFYHKYRSASVGDSESLLAQRNFSSSTNNKLSSDKDSHKGKGIAGTISDNKRKRADFFKGFTLSGETGGRHHLIPSTTVIQFESHKKGQGEGGENVTTSRDILSSSSSGSSPMSTSSTDFHQRQPLLSESKSGNGWCDDHTTHIIDIDDDDIPKESKRNGSVIRIDPPPINRGESEQTGLKRFPKEKRKTVAAFLWAAFNLAFATVSLALTHERRQEHAQPLPDIILDKFVPQDWALNVSEILIMVSTAVTALVILFHKHRWIVCRRVFFLVGILYLMRSLTMYVTVLPVASFTYKCAPKANDTSFLLIITRALRLMSGFGLSINGQQVYCGDYIYSGHTVILVSCYLIIQEYSSKKLYMMHWASWIASLTGIVMVLISRGHYTVDILIAYYVTTRLFWMYHTMANNPSLKNYSSNNFLARIWWFRVFQYLEGNVGGPLPRVYGCGILNWFSKHVKSRRNNRI